MRVLEFVFYLSLGLLISPASRSQTSIESLLVAIESDDSEFVGSYLEGGGNPNQIFSEIGTALQIAIESQSGDVALQLLDAGADVNTVTDSNKTPPLSLSLNEGESDLYNSIIDRGANLDLLDGSGQSAIFHAIKSDRFEALSKLIDNNADLEVRTDRGLTPLLLAFFMAKTTIIDSLVSNGALVDGKVLAENSKCAVCHSSKAPGVTKYSNIPNLAGQHAEYIAKQLRDYSSGARTHHKMDAPAKSLTEELIIALAEYYQKLPRFENSSTANEEVLKFGESVYENSCSSCHGNNGIDTVDLNTPTLAGLNALYTKFQLSFYKESKRVNDPDAAMRSIATDLSNADIEAVSEYIQNL